MDIVDVASIAIAGIAAIVSILAARQSRKAADRAEAAARERTTARRSLGEVLDDGNALLEEAKAWVRAGRFSSERARLERAYQEWDHRAFAAVKEADPALLHVYTAPLGSKLVDKV